MKYPPMISAKSLGEMPGFTLEHVGPRVLDRAMASAGLPHQFTDLRDGYIPEQVLASFIHEVGKGLGEGDIGLLWAPALTVADYGAWGRHVLGSDTLGMALARARDVMPLHSSHDRTQLHLAGSMAFYRYSFALPGHLAYAQIAFSALGVILSIFRNYLGKRWNPTRIHCDFDKILRPENAENAFGCPIQWNAKWLEIEFPRHVLEAQAPRRSCGTTTREDIMRERLDGVPQRFTQIVISVLHLQIHEHAPSIDRVAKALDLSVRTLQRRLDDENTSFRTLTNRVIAARAKELLRHGGLSVKSIATELGYSSHNNFSRAFRDQVGLSPRQYMAARSLEDRLQSK